MAYRWHHRPALLPEHIPRRLYSGILHGTTLPSFFTCGSCGSLNKGDKAYFRQRNKRKVWGRFGYRIMAFNVQPYGLPENGELQCKTCTEVHLATCYQNCVGPNGTAPVLHYNDLRKWASRTRRTLCVERRQWISCLGTQLGYRTQSYRKCRRPVFWIMTPHMNTQLE